MARDDGSHRNPEDEATAEASVAPIPQASLTLSALRGEGKAREGAAPFAIELDRMTVVCMRGDQLGLVVSGCGIRASASWPERGHGRKCGIEWGTIGLS